MCRMRRSRLSTRPLFTSSKRRGIRPLSGKSALGQFITLKCRVLDHWAMLPATLRCQLRPPALPPMRLPCLRPIPNLSSSPSTSHKGDLCMDCMSLVLRQYRHLDLPCCALPRAWEKYVTGEAIDTGSMQCVGAQLRQHVPGTLQNDRSAQRSTACRMIHVQEHTPTKGNTKRAKISLCCTRLIELIQWLIERHVVQACS